MTQKALRTIVGALVAMVVVAGWYIWTTRNAEPVASPPAVEQARSHADSASTPVDSDPGPSPGGSSGTDGPTAEEVIDDPVAQSGPDDVTMGVPPEMTARDFPPYLAVVYSGAVRRDSRGCKLFGQLLAEMVEEQRDELWAPRVERELEAMLGRHPHGFPVSVGCRATICQITAIGDHAALADDQGRSEARFWGNFMETFRRSAIASEFASSRFFGGLHATDPPRSIAGYVLTSVGYATTSEPPDCAAPQPAPGASE